jgi:hypothetical protein
MYLYLQSVPPSKRPKASLPRFAMNWLQRASKNETEGKPVAQDDPQSIRRRVQEQEAAEKMADAMRAKIVSIPDEDDARRVRQGSRRRDIT